LKEQPRWNSLAVERDCSNILAASSNAFTVRDLVTLTFDLILIGGRGIAMYYPCAEFGDFSFSRFGFIVRTDRFTHTHTHTHTQTQTESQRRINAILTRLPSWRE